MAKLDSEAVKKRVKAVHTCCICGANLRYRDKLKHFRALHPQYKISVIRRDNRHSFLKCDICGTEYPTYRSMVDHFNLVHDAARLPARGAEAWLDELTSRLEANKRLVAENKTLLEENKRLKEDYGKLLQKLVRLENILAQPER